LEGYDLKQERLKHVTDYMMEKGLAQLLISDPASIFYLTGKWILPGERLLVLHLNLKGEKKLFLNELFPIHEDLGVDLVFFNDTDDCIRILADSLEDKGDIGVDKNWPARFLLRLMDIMPNSKFVNGSDALDRARMIKDPDECDLMREASLLNDAAMNQIIETFDPNDTELDISRKLNDIYVSSGADGLSFTPIIAFGANAAMPHHDTGKAHVKPGDSIILDIGCGKDSYCSDMTRTVFYHSVSDKACEVYEIVRQANQAAIDMVKPGVRFCDVDAAARGVIEAAGYGPYFTHRTGHSIGIEVHDLGDVSSQNIELLQPGMIFSIEPGIYLEGEFGVRIEDLVLVTEDGCEVLNNHPKVLTIVS
jgi:Xaa-Pro dipeptidase